MTVYNKILLPSKFTWLALVCQSVWSLKHQYIKICFYLLNTAEYHISGRCVEVPSLLGKNKIMIAGISFNDAKFKLKR